METIEIVPKENGVANFSKRNVYISSGVFILILTIGIYTYTKQIEKTSVIPASKLEENVAYNEALKLQNTDVKKAAELINSIDIKNGGFTASEKVKILSHKKGFNSLSFNSKEYIDALKMAVSDQALPKEFRARNYEYLAVVLETTNGDKNVFSYVQEMFPEVSHKNILDTQMYFLGKAEEINKTPYQDLYRARFTLYSVDKNSSKEAILSAVEKVSNYITLVEKVKEGLPPVTEKTNLNNQLSYTKAFVMLYEISVLNTVTLEKNLEKKFGTALEISHTLFESSQNESRSQTRALMFYVAASTLSLDNNSDVIAKVNSTLKKNSTIPGLLDDAKGISSEIKRHLGDAVVKDIVKKFPEAKPYFTDSK